MLLILMNQEKKLCKCLIIMLKICLENESKQETGLKTLKMLQRLPIALAQIKAGNNSESLLNEIRQVVYSLYQSN